MIWYSLGRKRGGCPQSSTGMTIWIAIYRFAWIMVVILVVLILSFMAIPKFQKYQTLQTNKQTVEQAKQQGEEDLRTLQSNQEQFRTDDQFLIDTAREAGMVRSNEVVFKFTNVPSNVRSP